MIQSPLEGRSSKKNSKVPWVVNQGSKYPIAEHIPKILISIEGVEAMYTPYLDMLDP